MQHSTGYIIGFAMLICAVCSVVVAGAAVSLKDRQDRNVLLDRQSKVLDVAGLTEPGEKLSGEEITAIYESRIVPKAVNLATGEYDDTIDAATYDQRKSARDPATSTPAPENLAKVLRLPNDAVVFHVVENGATKSIILPVQGYGLWSTLYGYLALAPDTTTIQGLTFYEHGETPGLGGEVDNPRWKQGWRGRKAFDEDWGVAISVKKGKAGSVDADPYHVDGLSGATITSRGVTNAMRFWLGENGFGPYLAKVRANEGV